MNQITRSIGKKFHLQLKDGTKVYNINMINKSFYTEMKSPIVIDKKKGKMPESCGEENDELVEEEEMFVLGPAGMEWGGPTRGGKMPEPTRYGDWERKGRISDF